MTIPSSPSPKAALTDRFATLDIVRAFASLTVVIYHWFLFGGNNVPANAGMEPPFKSAFKFIYAHGNEAVDLFFCLSGFIFYWLYSAKIAAHSISLKKFAILRISRLYPLHLVTLLIAAAILPALPPKFSNETSLRQFILHLFMASEWFGQTTFTFNGPAWSISVEVLLYAVFFATCWVAKPRPIIAIGFVAAGILLTDGRWNLISRGIISFHMGALAYFALGGLERRLANRGRLVVLAICLAAWLIVPPLTDARHTLEWVRSIVGPNFKLHGKDVVAALVLPLAPKLVHLTVFPLTVLALALNESHWGKLAHRFGFLGNMSYSTYLLHVPLQFTFLLVVFTFGLNPNVLMSPWAMALFFAILIPLSLLSFTKFERPMQDWIRARLIPRPDKPAPQNVAGQP